jgi:hypothetical protein
VALGTAGAVVLGVIGVSASPASAAGTHVPIGAYDTLTRVAGGYDGTGWCYDADAPTTPCDVHIDMDGNLVAGTNAGVSRPDVAAAIPGAGPYHGFHFAYPYNTPGTHTVCVYAIDLAGPGANPLLGCKNISFPYPAATLGNYVGCVFGVGIPIGVAAVIALYPPSWSVLLQAATGIGAKARVPGAGLIMKYLNAVHTSCAAYFRG